MGQISPQKAPYGLYTEKLSGTSFTAPRCENKQTWVYRIIPAAAHQAFAAEPVNAYHTEADVEGPKHYLPNQLRWDPFDTDGSVDWVQGLHLIAGAGDATLKQGLGILVYAAGKSMAKEEAFYSADGDFLIVPQQGVLDIQTELGRLFVQPNEICIIPRGIR